MEMFVGVCRRKGGNYKDWARKWELGGEMASRITSRKKRRSLAKKKQKLLRT
jgi:hypothetical protein